MDEELIFIWHRLDYRDRQPSLRERSDLILQVVHEVREAQVPRCFVSVMWDV